MNANAPRERNWDAYAAVIASLIGLLALVVSGYTAYLQRQQTSAQVWPRLQIATSNINLKTVVVNQGVGPAKITGVRVAVDGKPVKRWYDVVVANGDPSDSTTAGFSFTSLNGTVLPPGESAEVFLPADTDASRKMYETYLDEKKHSFRMQICYCSVLDECWITDSAAKTRADVTKPVDACPIPEKEQFDN